MLDALIQSVFEVNIGFRTPNFFLDLIARYHLASAKSQQRQYLNRLWGQFDWDSVFAQFFGVEIQLEETEAK